MNTEKEETEDVVILDCEDLTSSSVSKNFFGVIHKQLLKNLTQLVYTGLLRAKQKRQEERLERIIDGLRESPSYSLNYFITGERGSGKTTFLRHLVENLQKEYPKSIGFLHWYDPSESFGVQEDFFIEVAAAIKTRFQEVSGRANRYSPKYDDMLMFQHIMQKLDKAIVRFSQGHEALSNLSEHQAAILRLDNPEMNKEIKKNFKECMRLLCGLYGVDAFVLVIDDIDIRTEQCYNVLENLRLFISNEYLVVLMAGDRTINIEHVRERFFKEYDYQYHQCDEQGREERLSYVVTHAAQYFAKLFPVPQQVELRSLYALSHKENSIKIELNIKEKQSLEKWLLKIFNIAISADDFEAKSHVDTFLSLPLRNIIQILEYWMREGILDKLTTSNSGDTDKKRNKEHIGELVRTALNRSLHDQLPDLFYNYEKLDSDDGRVFYALLLRLCQDTGDLEHGYYLSNEVERGSKYSFLTLVLAANFKRHVKDIKGFLSYLLYGPATITLYGKALEQFKTAEVGKNPVLTSQSDLQKSFEKYLYIGNWRSASRWARHANMIWCYDLDDYRLHSGVVRIQNSDYLKKINSYMKTSAKDQKKLRTTIAILVSMNKSDERDNSYYISLYSYLAYITRCVEICERIYNTDGDSNFADRNKQLEEKAKQEIFNLTKRYFEIKSCHRPEWQIKDLKKKFSKERLLVSRDILLDKNQKENTKGYDEPVSKESDRLMTAIIKWYKSIKKKQEQVSMFLDSITPYRMGNWWSAIYNEMRNISYLAPQIITLTVEQKKNLKIPINRPQQYLHLFNETTKIFTKHESSLPRGPITNIYAGIIGGFPLTEYFKLDDILLEKKVKKTAPKKKASTSKISAP